MRRLAILVAVAVALVFAAGASAKPTRITVQGRTTARAQVPWALTLHVSVHGKPYAKPGWHPTIYLVGRGGLPVASFAARLVGAGTYRARIVFPGAGTWRYEIPDPLYGDWYFVSPRVAA